MLKPEPSKTVRCPDCDAPFGAHRRGCRRIISEEWPPQSGNWRHEVEALKEDIQLMSKVQVEPVLPDDELERRETAEAANPNELTGLER